MQISCPTCQQHYEVPEDTASNTVTCRKCAQPFVIQEPEGWTIPPAFLVFLALLGVSAVATTGTLIVREKMGMAKETIAVTGSVVSPASLRLQEPRPGQPLSSETDVVTQTVQAVPPVNEIGITELLSVSRNILAAEKKYGGRELQIAGIIMGFAPLSNSVTLVDPTDTEATLVCHFGKTSGDYQALRRLAGIGRNRSNNPIEATFSSLDTVMTRDVSGMVVTLSGTYQTRDSYKWIGLHDCTLLTPKEEIDQYIQKADADAKSAQEQAELDEETAILAAKAVIPQDNSEWGKAEFYSHDWDTFFETKVVEFSGTLKRVQSNSGNRITVHFTTLDGKMGVECDFRSRHRQRIEQLTPDATVTIRGRATMWNRRWVDLYPCVFVD